MIFEENLELNLQLALLSLGYKNAAPDVQTAHNLALAARQIRQVASPRMVAKQFEIETLLAGVQVQGTNLVLVGKDIAIHLQNCTKCYVLCLSLGVGIDDIIRKTQVTDLASAVLLDVCASTLIEQYANLAQNMLSAQSAAQKEFVTGRFSPGYGDLPITLQPNVINVVNAQSAIGLTVSDSGIMLPRKSISAILGVAKMPVTGQLASCENCALKETCKNRNKEGACSAK